MWVKLAITDGFDHIDYVSGVQTKRVYAYLFEDFRNAAKFMAVRCKRNKPLIRLIELAAIHATNDDMRETLNELDERLALFKNESEQGLIKYSSEFDKTNKRMILRAGYTLDYWVCKREDGLEVFEGAKDECTKYAEDKPGITMIRINEVSEF